MSKRNKFKLNSRKTPKQIINTYVKEIQRVYGCSNACAKLALFRSLDSTIVCNSISNVLKSASNNVDFALPEEAMKNFIH